MKPNSLVNCQDISTKNGKRSLDICSVPPRPFKRFSCSPQEIIDDFNRTLDASYAEDVHYSHLENEECQWRDKSWQDSFALDTEVTQQMRGILVDWLIEVVEEFCLRLETLFLAVNYVDRVLETISVTRSTLQLVGITCLFIACKYEEVSPPLVEEFVYITDKTYTRENILNMENIVLNTLKFKLTVSTIQNFLTRSLLIADVTELRIVLLANYLAELILPVYSISRKYRPSQLAAAIVLIVKTTFNLQSSFPLIEAYTRQNRSDLRQCIREIYYLHLKIAVAPLGNFTAAREKYAKPKYGLVSSISLSPSVLAL